MTEPTVVERARYCREHGSFDALHGELLAEVERLHSWDGLMSLLDEHWPADIFPTMEDTEQRDPGPRIVSLLRWVERLSPWRVETDKELLALPVGSVIRDDSTWIYEKSTNGVGWFTCGMEDAVEPILPALVLWTPGDAQ